MNTTSVEYQKIPIEPLECLKSGWELIRDKYWLFLGITVVGTLISSAVPLAILTGPMMCGIFLCYLSKLRGEEVSFERLFKGFDHFVQSLIATLIVFGITFIILIPFIVVFLVGFLGAVSSDGGEAVGVGFVFLMLFFYAFALLIGVVVSCLFIFTYPLIVDVGLSGIEALKTSVKAVWANIWGILGLVLLNCVISFVGILFCYVGALFVMPVVFGSVTIAYRKVFPG